LSSEDDESTQVDSPQDDIQDLPDVIQQEIIDNEVSLQKSTHQQSLIHQSSKIQFVGK